MMERVGAVEQLLLLALVRLGGASAERGGKRKRLYRLTASGARAIAQARSTMTLMAQGLKPKLGTP
jgi:DNA-binding PadR family transcriptional regulator